MYLEQIKRLYDEANQAFVKAKAIQEEFAGKDMPAEKSAEVDTLLDKVDDLSNQAQRLDRMNETEKAFNDPTTRKSFFKEPSPEQKAAVIAYKGRNLSKDEIAELKALAPFAAYLGGADDEATREYAKAFGAYHRKGRTNLSAAEVKALQVGDAPAGGYLVQDTYLEQLIVKSREVSAMRRLATILPPVPSGAVITPSEDSLFSDATWTPELGTGDEDTVKPFGDRRLQPHPLAKRVKVSNTLMRNPNFDTEAYVRDRMAYKFAVPEENAYINGNGAQQPLGLLNTSGLPVFTTATANKVYGDDIINWVYLLPAAYAPNARILCNRAFIRKVRQLTIANASVSLDTYIWQPSLQAGQPGRILDVPYELSDRFDDGLDGSDAWESNAKVAVIGDFSYFWIVDALTMTIQRLNELYAETNQTGFIGRKESDGLCVLPEAFYALKVKA